MSLWQKRHKAVNKNSSVVNRRSYLWNESICISKGRGQSDSSSFALLRWLCSNITAHPFSTESVLQAPAKLIFLMHTSDYITSLFNSFLSLPMASPIKSNVLCVAFRDGCVLALLHLHLLLWFLKHQLSTERFLWPATLCLSPPPLSTLLPTLTARGANKAPRGFLVCERQPCVEGEAWGRRFQRRRSFGSLAKCWWRPWSQREKARWKTVMKVVLRDSGAISNGRRVRRKSQGWLEYFSLGGYLDNQIICPYSQKYERKWI